MDPKSASAVRAPLNQASTLPPSCYTSPEWYQREVHAIFEKDWLYVARVEDIAIKNDYTTLDVVGRPIVLVNNGSGIRAFLSLCRHRGTVLTTGRGNTPALVCPYHSWSYDLQGNLIGAPGMDCVQNFDKSENGLIPVHCEVWNSFIFVNLAKNPMPFLERFSGVAAVLSRYKPETLKLAHTRTYQVKCNWKAYVENANEVYHVNSVHSRSLAYALNDVYKFVETDETFALLYGLFPGTLGLLAGENPPFPPIQSEEDLTQKNRHDVVLLYPCNTFAGTTDSLATFTVLPKDVDHSELTIRLLFPATTMNRPNFAKDLARYLARMDVVAGEDNIIIERNAAGHKVGLAPPGRFHNCEFTSHQLAKFVVNRVLDAEV